MLACTEKLRLVSVAAVMIAFVAPKKTMFWEAVVLKLVPVRVMFSPMAPVDGEMEVMVGAVVDSMLRVDA